MLGEYSYLLDKETPEQVITKLYKLLMNDSVSSETKAWLIAAVTKLTAQAHSSNVVEKLIQEFTGSISYSLGGKKVEKGKEEVSGTEVLKR